MMRRRKYVTHDELEARVRRAVEAACEVAGRGDAELEAQIRERHARRPRVRHALGLTKWFRVPEEACR